MHHHEIKTILVIQGDQDRAGRAVQALTEAGYNVIGPVQRASYALALAAQAHADLALVDVDLEGRRNGLELANELRETWGVPTVLIADPENPIVAPEGQEEAAALAPDTEQVMAVLRRAARHEHEWTAVPASETPTDDAGEG